MQTMSCGFADAPKSAGKLAHRRLRDGKPPLR
jgi:hypothetical protein